ncbi:MAG: hypothetical protein JW915_14300 [Chitinispirillaceae bacterium]|nr:hypothetical protein [Chitinispirillaceae bacterium]
MSTFKSLLHAKCNAEVRIGLCFVILTLLMLTAPAVNPLQNAQAAIDDAMPASFPKEVVDDWKDQDKVSGSSYDAAITKIVGKLPDEYKEKYEAGKGSYSGEKLYLFAHHLKRVSKMKPHESDLENVMCMKHHNFGGMVVGYHDNTESGNSDFNWASKGSMCLLEMKTYYPTLKEILKKDRVVRDPCISFDGKKVLFAMSDGGKGTGYKIYEMEIDNPANIKQLTKDPGVGKVVADFEPCYLPNGDIAFTSTRCFGFVDCATHPVTNMFLMSGDGKHIRQVGFDQVNTFYPVVTDLGEVMYTRWEYNDRDLTNSMGIFTMNPDGCHQREWFGNQISFPMTIIHARPIQNSEKVVAIAGGHHGPYQGELLIIDRMAGENPNDKAAIKMICPVRPTKPDANKSDIGYGGIYFTFQTPYGLDDNSILVSWRKNEGNVMSNGNKFNLYLMDTTGSRELLAWGDQSISQPVIVKTRKVPPKIATNANYSDSLGEFTLQNVYYGPGMVGVEKGKAKSLRVIKLHYRVQTGAIGMQIGSVPSGAFQPAISCPISQYGCSWEAKEVLGETPIYEDGSASFKVPARAPVYFQVLDSMGYCIATMRSWSTLMPGEKFPCFGCHENTLEATPGTGQIPKAGDPKPLEKPLGIEDKPFDYPKMVQPILDKHCTSCHKGNHASGFDLTGSLSASDASKKWATSYKSLLKGIGSRTSNNAVNINTIFSTPEQKAPYSFGACKSNIMTKVLNGTSHADKFKTEISDKEKRIIACWIDLCAPHSGKYESYYRSSSDSTKYMGFVAKRTQWQKIEKEGLKDLATAVIPDNNNAIKPVVNSVKQLTIGYIPKQRTLVLNNPGQGNFLLVDLMGNVVSRMKISNQISGGTVSISLPASLSTGCYLAKFEGSSGIQQAKVTFTK